MHPLDRTAIPAPGKHCRHTPSDGSTESCHFIGGEHDGEEVKLLSALKQVVGHGIGTVLSCVPGKLAYFEGEIRERFLLVRQEEL